MINRFFFAIILLLTTSVNVFSHDIHTGDIVIDHSVIPSTVKSAPVAAGYMTITNKGEKDDKLLYFQAPFSNKTSIHEMKMVEGVMRMRPLDKGLVIPAGESVALKKGGFHLMFQDLKEQMENGQIRQITLGFEEAGRMKVDMLVVDPADLDAGEVTDHSGHSNHSGHE